MNTDFDAAAALPSQIPIFPLPNALLLPGGQLPLNIFEPRYLAMIEDALGASGRYMIALNGVSRFRLQDHKLTSRGYRLADVDWEEFVTDLEDGEGEIGNRDHMFSVMRRYFDQRGFEADWDQIERSDDNAILNTLAMVCPFDVAEKQALLEAEGMSRRADLLVAMMEMALHEDDGQNDAIH
jgi:hypothetical protein